MTKFFEGFEKKSGIYYGDDPTGMSKEDLAAFESHLKSQGFEESPGPGERRFGKARTDKERAERHGSKKLPARGTGWLDRIRRRLNENIF
jgi:hypothetical protein